jgi:hypothetical protein
MSQLLRSLNALKHGGYSNLGVLPGEDPKEFTRFHQSVIADLDPSGPIECDIVLNLAKCLWRKSRLGIYAVAEAARKEWGPVYAERDNAYWDLTIQLMKKSRQDSQRLIHAMELHESSRKALIEQLPHLKELKTCSAVILKVESGGEGEEELTREGSIELELASLGDRITIEGLTKEIELDARLEARIDRLLKRLYQLKAAKQMLGLGSRTTYPATAAARLSSPAAEV